MVVLYDVVNATERGISMDRKTIIQTLIDTSENKNYLEIGTWTGDTFVSIKSNFKVGVDPILPSDLIKSAISENCVYHSLQSDVFFENEANSNVKFDVVFIDGLHEYEQAYRDIVNSLDHLANEGFIVVHDCKPSNPIMSMPPKDLASFIAENNGWDIVVEGAWTGNVWKAIVRLRSFHNDLHVFTLDCDCGVAVITKGKPEKVLSFSLQDIDKMTYDDFSKNYRDLINLKPYLYLNMFLQKLRNGNVDGRRKILYGAGYVGALAFGCYGADLVHAFADMYKHGAEYLGKAVIHPSSISDLSSDYEIIICAEKYDEMVDYLNSMGVEKYELFYNAYMR